MADQANTRIVKEATPMKKTTLNISHLLPINRETAARIAMCASRFDCVFTLEHGNSVLNMKSMLGLLSQIMPKDGNVTLIADGSDEDAAMAEIIKVIE